MSKRSTARVMLETLRNHGVDTLFGIISSHTIEIFGALYDLRDDFRFIGARHEHAAAMMADGYARVTGRAGVVLTSTGPGAANSIGGMGEAYFASSPLLNITSNAEEQLYERGLGTIHEIKNQVGMFESVTQRCYHVSRPEDVVGPVCEAFELFSTPLVRSRLKSRSPSMSKEKLRRWSRANRLSRHHLELMPPSF